MPHTDVPVDNPSKDSRQQPTSIANQLLIAERMSTQMIPALSLQVAQRSRDELSPLNPTQTGDLRAK